MGDAQTIDEAVRWHGLFDLRMQHLDTFRPLFYLLVIPLFAYDGVIGVAYATSESEAVSYCRRHVIRFLYLQWQCGAVPHRQSRSKVSTLWNLCWDEEQAEEEVERIAM
jgi:hypothetical protein